MLMWYLLFFVLIVKFLISTRNLVDWLVIYSFIDLIACFDSLTWQFSISRSFPSKPGLCRISSTPWTVSNLPFLHHWLQHKFCVDIYVFVHYVQSNIVYDINKQLNSTFSSDFLCFFLSVKMFSFFLDNQTNPVYLFI